MANVIMKEVSTLGLVIGISNVDSCLSSQVDDITKDPSIASSDHPLPCQSPILFKQYLPVGLMVYVLNTTDRHTDLCRLVCR